MKSIRLIAYQTEFGRGSEFGSGYEIVAGILEKYPTATIISRVKNIEILRTDPKFKDCTLIGFDVPKYLGFYKRKAKGLTPYYITWLYLTAKKVAQTGPYEIIHLINFHSDVYPHFLKNPNGRLIWGPIAHHPFIPPELIYRKPQFAHIGLEYLKLLTKQVLWRSPWMKRAIERSDKIFCCNPLDMPPTFKKYESKIEYLNMVARPIDITPQPPPAIESDFRLLFIGRFPDMKGTVFALETFHLFVQKHPSAHLTIIGKGPLKKQLSTYVKENHLQKSVQILSWLPQEELFSFHQHAHVFFFPSMETQGPVVTEAMQFGLPILCLKTYGPHSLAREAAITVSHEFGNKQKTQQALITELENLYEIKDSSEYQTLREKTRESYEKNLSVPAQVAQIQKHFSSQANTIS